MRAYSFRHYLTKAAQRVKSSWRLQVLNPCRSCTKPVCNVIRNRVKSVLLHLPGSCYLLLMSQGVSHVCPYWGQGMCLYRGEGRCFFLEKERKPEPAYFRKWFSWRQKLLKFLLRLSAPLGETGEGRGMDPARPLPFEEISRGCHACPFILFSDPKRTVLPVLPSVLEGYQKGYLLTRWEALLGKRKAGSSSERQAALAAVLQEVEEAEKLLNGTCGGLREEFVGENGARYSFGGKKPLEGGNTPV